MSSLTPFDPPLTAMATNPARMARHGWLVLLALLSGLGIAAGLYMNRLGVDVEPDSAVYITAGIHFAHGEGVSLPNLIGPPEPLTWFPPVTPWMVAVCEWTGVNIRQSFGVFNAVSWGLLIAWVGLLARRGAGGRSILGLFAAGAVLTSSAICRVHGFLYSEPPFLLCLMGTLMALAFWWERPRLRWVAVAGICVGCGLLTRYVGLTLVMLGTLSLLCRPGLEWRRRFAALGLFGLLSLGPIAGWHFWQTTVRSAAAAERTLAWHPITGEQINEGIATLASFIVPEKLVDSLWATRIVAGLMAAAVGIALWIRFGRGGGKSRPAKSPAVPALVGISAAFIVIYPAFLVASISVADASTPLDWRLLSVTVPPGAIVVAYLAFAAIWARGGRWARGVAAFAAAALLVTLGNFTFRDDVCRQTVFWMPGETIEVLDALQTVPADAIVFSNAPCEFYMVGRRKTEGLPSLPENGAGSSGQNKFTAGIAAMRKTLAARGGWVVYWDGLSEDPVISKEMLRTVLPVSETKSFRDGVLIRIAPPRETLPTW